MQPYRGRMRVVYRDWWRNIGFAALFVVVGGVFGAGAWSGDGEQGPEIGWLAALTAAVFLALGAARSLRRSVVVDDDGITNREIWGTTFVPWTAVTEVEFRGRNRAHFLIHDGSGIRVEAPERPGQLSLRGAYVQVRERWSDGMGRGAIYPGARGRAVSIGFIVAACLMVIGAVVWDDARFDAGRYAARERRDRVGNVSVTRVHVEEQSHEDGDSTYTTYVEGWLRVPGHGSVLVDLHRAGDLARNFAVEDRVPVVYDAARPRDADFADRPNRQGDHDSAVLRSVTGRVAFWIGAVGAVACGLAIGVETARRGPVRRRTWLTLR
jgi:hypothetical protein